jgi:hypothetical protein
MSRTGIVATLRLTGAAASGVPSNRSARFYEFPEQKPRLCPSNSSRPVCVRQVMQFGHGDGQQRCSQAARFVHFIACASPLTSAADSLNSIAELIGSRGFQRGPR